MEEIIINKEEIYDTQISPLMKQIIEICKKEQIPMWANFQYTEEDFCKTFIPCEGHHVILLMIEGLSQCLEGDSVNIDKFYFWCAKNFKNKSSIVMQILQSGNQLNPINEL